MKNTETDELKSFWEAVYMPGAARAAAEAFAQRRALSAGEYLQYKTLFTSDKDAFYAAVKREEEWRLLFLYLYVRFAFDLRRDYAERGISERIYADTFGDIGIWAENCYRETSRYGIADYDWLSRHLECKLYRLGRLQYEKMESLWEIEASADGQQIHVGDVLINVHIPQGEKLSAADVAASFRQARDFWKKDYAYVCHSWLLYPGLKEVLPADSNILQFQQFFDIRQTDYCIREAETRIYGRPLEDAAAYPEQTLLQRKAKAYLLSGKKLGNGLGVLKKQ